MVRTAREFPSECSIYSYNVEESRFSSFASTVGLVLTMINNFWTSGEMSNSESVVSWRKVAVFGLAVGLPIVGYVVWKRVNKKRVKNIFFKD